MLNFVPTPIGNLDDISKRALTALENCDLIFCEDTRVTKKLLNLLNISFENKNFVSMHSHNENKILASLDIDTLKSKNCVYVSDAGMPAISDPGAKLVKFCQENGVEYSVLPGPSAFVTAFAASGFEGEFCFYAFLPHKGKERVEKLKKALFSGKISIFYESPHRIEKLVKELKELVPEREIFLAKELTKIYETYIKCRVKDLELPNSKGEWVVIIDKGESRKIEFSYEEILELPLPLKMKAKLLSKISDFSTKEIYKKLSEEKNGDYKDV